jgi:ADP-ribose pyrophosphatase YjhB (NUDIX family)
MQVGVDYIGISTPFYCHDGKGRFVLHKRSLKCRDDYGVWDPGGGQLEFGSMAEENVLREVKEEYGCDGVITDRLPTFSVFRDWDGKRTHWLAAPFFIQVNPKEVRINEPDKIDELGWFTLNSLPSPLHPGFVIALKNFPECFKKYGRTI